MEYAEAQQASQDDFVEASKLDTKEMGEFVKAEAKLLGHVTAPPTSPWSSRQ